MVKKISTTSKLFLLVLVLFSLILGIGIYSNREIKEIKKSTDQLYNEVLTPIVNLTNVRFSYLRGIKTIARQLSSKDISYKEALIQLDSHENNIKLHWNYFLKTYHTPEEKKLIRPLEQLMGITEDRIKVLKASLLLEDRQAMTSFILRDLLNAVRPTVDGINQLVEYEEFIGKDFMAKNNFVYEKSKTRYQWIVLFALVIALTFAFYIVYDIRFLLKTIQKSNDNLKQSELKYRSVFDSAGDGLFLVGPDKLIKEVNNVGVSITGYSYPELLKMDPIDLHTTEDLIQHPFKWELLAQGKPFIRQRKLLKKDGSTVDIEMNTTLVGDNEILSVVRDISDRIKAEEAIKTSDQKYGMAIMNTVDSIHISTFPEGKIIEMNPAFEKLFGFTNEDTNGKSLEDLGILIDPEVISFLERSINKDGFVQNEKITIKNKTGEEIIGLITANLFHIKNEPFLYTLIRNITVQEKIEKELKVTELRIKNLVNSTEAVIWEVDAEKSQITYINPFAEKLFGYPAEDWYTSSFWENHIYPEDKEATIEFWENQTKKLKSFTFEYRFITKNKEVLWIRDIVNIVTENGEPRWLRGIMIDVTEEKNKEVKLKELTTRLQLATQSASLGIFDLDIVQSKLIWDDTSYEIFGVSREECKDVYAASFDLIHPKDREYARIYRESIIENGGEYHFVFRILKPNGEIRHIESNAILLRDQIGNVSRMIGINRDITEIRLAQKQLKNMNVVLEERVTMRTADLETANRNINDSINYARNIQRAILSDEIDCAKIFQKSFVLWMPKDVVSGDFLWCYSDSTYNYMALVDCTGHGVPGAFLSIVASQTLDTIVITKEINEPEDILFQLDEIIVNALHESGKMVKDGMDIAFCRIEKKTNAVVFAGAQRPLFYFDGTSVIEYPGSKVGIGGFLNDLENKKFKQIEIQGKPGDILYLSSDGYYSQFGGEKGKKLMKKKFCNYLLNVSTEEIKEQKYLLNDYFTQWQGEEEQVDDVMVIGIQL